MGRSWVSRLIGSVALLCASATAAQAQVHIDVVASSVRDGINVPYLSQQMGIAEDGAIAFGAHTPLGQNRLLLAEPGRAVLDLNLSARAGSDVGINDDSVVFVSGAEVLAFPRSRRGTPVVLHDCTVSSTPCGGTRHVGLSSDGHVVVTAFDSIGGIYRGRVAKGRIARALTAAPVPAGFISALGVDVGAGGPFLLLGDHSAQSAEVYGAFSATKSLYRTEVSTRPQGGSEAPLSAVYGGRDVFALLPAQTNGSGATLAAPALVSGLAQSYGSLQVQGTPLLTLGCVGGAQCPSVGSMDVNDFGVAAVVAQLTSGWTGLFAFDTTNTSSPPVLLTQLNAQLGKCVDRPVQLHVLGTNNSGQVAVLARVQWRKGTDTQVWRLTPTGTKPRTTSHCLSELF